MGFTGTILGGLIGGAMGGPLGAIVGAMLGGNIQRGISGAGQAPGPGSYRAARAVGAGPSQSAAVSLVVLMAAVTKVDQRVTRGEVTYVRDFLVRSFGPDNAADLMQIYKEALDRDLDISAICRQITQVLDHPTAVQIIHTLIGLVQADEGTDEDEIRVIRDIAGRIGLSQEESRAIEAMYWNDSEHAYQVLGASQSDSMDEIKKKYRTLVKQYHPDKVSHLGIEFKELAKQKFVQIQQAYESIEKSRAG